ncbi:DUF4178 domain-containing protein [Planctomycetota bacterium]|nr:DUF4178 domain-containing protein [Planctomycetota bacterium]
MNPRDKFRLMAAMALVDSDMGADEQAVLLRAADGLGLSRGDALEQIDFLMGGGRITNLTPPTDSGERRELFKGLIDVVTADGNVAPQELNVLQNMAQQFGLNPQAVPAMIEHTRASSAPNEFELVDDSVPAAATAQTVSLSAPGGRASGRVIKKRAAPSKRKTSLKGGSGSCPSCGATVEFKNARSVAMVCEYCDTTVVREDGGQVLADLGKVANVREDASPIQIGASGKCFGVEFHVIGRLQIEHSTGYWNEWFLEWADKRTGWLSEAQGTYCVTLPADVDPGQRLQVPEFEDLHVGRRVSLRKKRWTVTDVRVARATGTQGETPFTAPEGYELPYVDLRRSDNGFATIDYSDDEPIVFTGRCVRWKDLHMRNYRRFDGWS